MNARIRSWKQGGGRPGDLAGQVYCILPRELADELYDVLVAWFADARDVTVIIDSRRRDRRRAERRLQEAPALGDRRSIRHRAGRRFFERRALGIDVSALTLPREARRHADRIRFLERLEPTRAEAMDRDSARLVARVQAGERAAYDDLYLRYFTAVYRYVRVIVGDDHEAEDITQETFISALDALPRYEIRPEQPFRVYLLRIARNRSVDHVRKHTPMGVESPEQVTRLREALEPEDPLGDLGWISDGELEGIVGRLPLQQRQALVLRFALGFSHDEVARILELTPQASRNLQHRALAFIRSRLAAVSRRSSGGERHTMALRARFGRVIAERKGSLRGPLARNRVA